jgi:hypothetical protein
MKHERENAFGTTKHVERMGAEMAIQFHVDDAVSNLVANGGRSTRLSCDVHRELVDLVATYKLPPMPNGEEAKGRAAARTVIDGLTLKCAEPMPRGSVS